MDALLLKVSKDRSEDEWLREAASDLLEAERILQEDLSDLESDPDFQARLVFEGAVHALSFALHARNRFAGEEHTWAVWRLAERGRLIEAEARKRLENI